MKTETVLPTSHSSSQTNTSIRHLYLRYNVNLNKMLINMWSQPNVWDCCWRKQWNMIPHRSRNTNAPHHWTTEYHCDCDCSSPLRSVLALCITVTFTGTRLLYFWFHIWQLEASASQEKNVNQWQRGTSSCVRFRWTPGNCKWQSGCSWSHSTSTSWQQFC